MHPHMKATDLYPDLLNTIESLDCDTISADRKQSLLLLADYIGRKLSNGQAVRLNFICTHNSRRSHLCQVWAQTLGTLAGLTDLNCYSGGTESTAVFPASIQALKQAGFQITKLSDEPNPVFAIKFDDNSHPIIGFSKRHDHPFNPKQGFAAVMTCSEADQACPYVPGAEAHISLPFMDPKASDGSPEQARTYAERSLEIATQMKFMFEKALTYHV